MRSLVKNTSNRNASPAPYKLILQNPGGETGRSICGRKKPRAHNLALAGDLGPFLAAALSRHGETHLDLSTRLHRVAGHEEHARAAHVLSAALVPCRFTVGAVA